MGRGHGGRKRKASESRNKEGKGKASKGGKGDSKGGKGEPGKRRSGGPPPARAVLVTSGTPSQCPKATREAIALLEDALGDIQTESKKDIQEDAVAPKQELPDRSMGESLEAELKAIRGDEETKAPKRPIRLHSEVSRGVALLTYPGEEDKAFPAPSCVAERVFAVQRSGAQNSRVSRFVVRMIPLDFVCSPHLKQFQAAAASALPKLLADAKAGAGWYCAFHSRAMSTIKREDALAVLKEILVPLNLDLSVSDYDYMIVIEVNPDLCGFSVLRNYETDWHECHLQKATRENDNFKSKDAADDSEEDEEEEEEDQVPNAE